MPIGAALAAGAINTGMGLLLEDHNDKRQLRQNQAMLNQQYGIDNRMAEANYEREMRMWNETNYSAQVGQLEKAGMNPALLYAKGGQGGVTMPSSGSVHSNGAAPAGGMEIMNMMMNKAQMDLIKAQTEKTKAETTAVAPGIEKTQAETASITQGIQNQKAVEELTKDQDRIANIAADIAEKSENLALSKIVWETQLSYEHVRNLKAQNTITEEEAKNIKDRIALQLAGIGLQNTLTKTQAGAIVQEVMQKWQQVAQGWQGLSQGAMQLQIHKFEAETKAQYPGIFPLISKWINYTVETLSGNTAPEAKPIKQ